LIVHGWLYSGKPWIDSPTMNNFVKRVLYTNPVNGMYPHPDSHGNDMKKYEKGFIRRGILQIYQDKAVDSQKNVNWFVDPQNLAAFRLAHPNARKRE